MRKRLKIFLLTTAAFVAILSLWAFWWEPASLRITQECVVVKWTPPRPLRAALLTDLHVGSPFNGVDKLREIVNRTNAAAPDVVFILGDLVVQGVVGGSFVAPEDIVRELGRLRAPSGIFAVLGNHDVWLGAQRVQMALNSVGIVVLEDQAVNVETPAGFIQVAGVSDMWTRPHDVRAAIAGASTSHPLLVLTHNPDVFPEIPPSVTLTLAGHTHGGQVRLPLLGAPVVPSRYGQRFAAGHIVEGGRHLYVATGIGTSILPVRFGVPPSIVVLTIGSACT